jgi:hypothetical protein
MKPQITVNPADPGYCVIEFRDAKGNSVQLRCERAIIFDAKESVADVLEGGDAEVIQSLLRKFLPQMFGAKESTLANLPPSPN